MKYLIRTFIVASFLCASTSFAQQQGGVSINGDVNIAVETGDVSTTATGQGAVAEAMVASVGGSNTLVNGNVTIAAKTGDITTTAKGKNAKACSTIGAVGTNACQKDDGGNN